jgi:DNA-binding response OmpR family regulator
VIVAMPDNPLKILLIEDNPGDARLVGEMLSSTVGSDFQVLHAKRLDEAVALLAEDVFDAVLLDLSLPDSTGMQTIDDAKAFDAEHNTPIIVITGRYTDEDALQTMQHGAQDFLLKNNLRAESLIRSIRFAVEREQSRRRERSADVERRQAAEIESLELMGAPATTLVTARAFGHEPLADASPDTFEMLKDQYCELIEQALEHRRFRIDSKISQSIRVLAQRLGFLRAGPRDVVELHVTSLKAVQPEKMTTSYVVAEEARLLLIELMGSLAGYYRDHMMPVKRFRAPDIPETRTDQSRE